MDAKKNQAGIKMKFQQLHYMYIMINVRHKIHTFDIKN